MRSSCLAIAERLRQNLRESGASRVLDHLPLALALLPVAIDGANERFFLPLLDARSNSISSLASTRRCPWTSTHTSSSSASPAERRNREPNAGLVARGGRSVGRVALGKRANSRARARVATADGGKAALSPQYYLFCSSSESSILTSVIATIGACRTWGRG